MKNFKKILTKIPNKPGVYQFLNDEKEPLYIGKAKNLRKRVQTYFRQSAKHSPRTAKMLEYVEDIKWIETNSEVEALILEDNLVKELQPKYNVLLRDDKNFQYIKVTVEQDYPEIYTVRRITKDHAKGRTGGAKYFGPKTSGSDVKRLVDTVKRVFRLCSVRNINLDPKGKPLKGAKVAVKIGTTSAKRPCLDYHIKRCVGPCAGMVTPEEYRVLINQAIEFLGGDYKPAIESLKKQMREFATAKKFERAAKLRDQIMAIERSAEKQLITSTDVMDRDVIASVQDLGRNFFNLFQIRNGRLIGQENFIVEGGEGPAEVMETFLRDYYAMAADIPKEILISIEVGEHKLLQDYIRQFTRSTSLRAGKAVQLIHPQVGKKDDLILLSEKNARSFAEQNRARWMMDKREEKALEELKEVLKLEAEPKRIECYDISHLSGTETVGSMVVFKKGEPATADYRQFRLKTTQGSLDDYKSMVEVLRRRLNYLPAVLPESYKLEKAKKKDEAFLRKVWDRMERFDVKQFYVIRKKEKIVAIGRIDPLDEKVHRIAGLWVDKKEQGKKLGHFIIKKLIETSKQKRLYLFCHQELETYYLKLGFDTLHQPPKELSDHAKKYLNEVKKPLYMAYQKKKKDLSFETRPNLIVIDGGKGQLHAAHDVLFEKGLSVPIIALAKRIEEVFIPGKSEPINLKSDSEGSYLLQRIRDEAHRFAIEYNRSSRDKKMTQSALDKIPGVGPKLRKRLLTYFGSVQKIREAPQVTLEQIAGENIAKRIKENL
ncbi:excinuclease ABC subunit UvrC [Patescibacteria group bacterium]|nr:excinuclease ABC subunit UvrC [Patescibacteria group bacterium]